MRLSHLTTGLAFLASTITGVTAAPTVEPLQTVNGVAVYERSLAIRENSVNAVQERSLVARDVYTYRRSINLVLRQAVGKFAAGSQWMIHVIMTFDPKANNGAGSITVEPDKNLNAENHNVGKVLANVKGHVGGSFVNGAYVVMEAVMDCFTDGMDAALRYYIGWVDDVYADDGYSQLEHYNGAGSLYTWPKRKHGNNGLKMPQYKGGQPAWDGIVSKYGGN